MEMEWMETIVCKISETAEQVWLKEAGEILAGCGFSYYAEFKGRKPVFRRIVP